MVAGRSQQPRFSVLGVLFFRPQGDFPQSQDSTAILSKTLGSEQDKKGQDPSSPFYWKSRNFSWRPKETLDFCF